jgi:uncharacterized RDD family membrane protein YckC
MNCQTCGAETRPGDSACAHCGTPLATSPPPPADAPAPPDVPPLAGPWPRYWARTLDLTLWTLLCAFALGVFAPQWLDATFPTNERLQEQLLGLILLPFAMAGDAITYMLFGNTPGKWAAGLRVRDVAGQKLKPLRYLARNARLYLNGLALGLGLIAIITLIHQYRRVSPGALTSWDERLDSRVRRVRGGILRTSVTATLVLVVLVGSVGLGEYTKNMSPEDNLQWIAAIANRGAPSMLTEHTRLDRVSVAPGLVLQYDYTLLDVDSQQTAIDTAAVRKEMAGSMCDDLLPGLDPNARVRFRYANRQGKPLAAVDISKADCPEKP